MNILNNYIYTNSSLVTNKFINIIELSEKNTRKNKCPICNVQFQNYFIYKKKSSKIKLYDYQLHLLQIHNVINTILYKTICNININDGINWCLFNTNSINVVDALYEIGSNQIYGDKNNIIQKSKKLRFSEHSGFINIQNNKVSDITILNDLRVDKSDPYIYLPNNTLEALKVNYLFHTHPKTPYIGSRIKNGIIYEFPSVSDILHFIEHHNNGKLLGSIIITPEGIYIIRKNHFDRSHIKIDYDIFIDKLEDTLINCYEFSLSKYSYIDYKKHIVNGNINIPENIFYNDIAINYNYINLINDELQKYNLFIDYYTRILLNNDIFNVNRWIFPDIYLPIIN